MRQILRDSPEIATSASSVHSDGEETLIDLNDDGFTRVTNKKKTPKKTQPKTVVDSPKRPPTPRHKSQKVDLPQQEPKTPNLQ